MISAVEGAAVSEGAANRMVERSEVVGGSDRESREERQLYDRLRGLEARNRVGRLEGS